MPRYYLNKEGLTTLWAQIKSKFLPKTGGTLTGTLYTTGAGFIRQYSGVNLTQSNNGVSSTVYPAVATNFDVGGRGYGYFRNRVYANGSVGTEIRVANYNGTTSLGDRGIGVYMDKSGNVTYLVDTPAAFRSAIEIGSLNRVPSTYRTGLLSLSNTSTGCYQYDTGVSQSQAGCFAQIVNGSLDYVVTRTIAQGTNVYIYVKRASDGALPPSSTQLEFMVMVFNK